MSIALPEAIQQARQSLEDGDYQEAVSICSAIVNQYPACEAAYRLLGEALLEQGQASEAERAFGRAISHDPRQPASYLGLGRIAEDRGALENALAFCQVAWELAPNLPEYREPVVQIASRQFSDDGYLQLTHAALAQIYLRSSRLKRAVREFEIALSALPDRVDLWIGLAESLWRLGQDANAADISREFLKEHPDLAQALVILADIEFRQGDPDQANHLQERLRRVDPDGVIVRAMVCRNSLAATDFLLIREADVPIVETRIEVVPEEHLYVGVAPAPDFGYGTEEAEASTPAEGGDSSEPVTDIAATGANAAGVAVFFGGEDRDEAVIEGQVSSDGTDGTELVEPEENDAEPGEEAIVDAMTETPASDDDLATATDPEPVEETVPAEATDEPEIRFETGAMQNSDALRAALQEAPDDDELHWRLAEALREGGETGEAMSEYRWLIRQAPDRRDAVMVALNACIDDGQEVEMAHRLLADIYRRSGDRARASSHAQLAVKARRNQR